MVDTFAQSLPRPFASKRMDRIDQLIDRYGLKNDKSILNVSTWHFSDGYHREVLSHIRWPTETYFTNYNYPWELGLDVEARKAFSIPDSHDCLFLSNTSQAIVLLAFLTGKLSDRACVCNPSYWSLEENISAFGSDVIEFYPQVEEVSILAKKIKRPEKTTIWITRPLFSTGTNHEVAFYELLEDLTQKGAILVFDEALSNPYTSVSRELENKERSFFILSPHKYLNVNGLKFSALIFPRNFKKFLIEYSDSFFGSLPGSSIAAVTHFLSDNYREVLARFDQWSKQANREIEALASTFPLSKMEKWDQGIYRTIYFTNLPADIFEDTEKFCDLLDKTNCALIPGTFNKAPEDLGLSFRINLSLWSASYLANLRLILSYLSSL